MHWIKIGFVNFVVLLVLIAAIEVMWRIVWTAESCLESKCNSYYLTRIKIHDDNIGHSRLLFRFDDQLGFVPREGSDYIINDHDWCRNARVTIADDGYRLNNVDMSFPIADILAVGDSFTFGAQVSNHQTWPACLERMLQRGVDNYGISGYGAAQSLKRASLKIKQKNYSAIIFSILVGDDFSRDRLSYRYGFPKPSLIKENNEIKWSSVSDPNKPGSVFNASRFFQSFFFLYKRSLMFCYISNSFPSFRSFLQGLIEVHPKAAEEKEIIEWTLRKFSEINIPVKILLLQYYAKLNDSNMLAERKLILKIAQRLPIKVIDTFNYFRGYSPKKIWFFRGGHHTPLGNEIVCNSLFEGAFKSKPAGYGARTEAR
ncbi:SGNH/GDSL hydrolase family protein [Candidatus Electronema sp. PJ]|uniref:SGNH/GDSL hydrolase family protein n=1 Tax=Candidatus Electronema sp. PJ TaxID=3401572 RepID=UPI003AA95C77